MSPTPPKPAPDQPPSERPRRSRNPSRNRRRMLAAAAAVPLAVGLAYLPTTDLWPSAAAALVSDAPGPGAAVQEESAAHWLDRTTLAWEEAVEGRSFWLYTDPESAPEVGPGTGAVALEHDPEGIPEDLREGFPHLADHGALTLPDGFGDEDVRELLKGGLAVAAFDGDDTLVDATGLQVPGVLDDLYADAADRDLGPRWDDGVPGLDLWAPTARSVSVDLYDGPRTDEPFASHDLADTGDGVWSVDGEADWQDAYYLFQVEVFVPETGQVEHNTVTDPYSVGLAADGERSALLDLADVSDPGLAPEGWADLDKPETGEVVEESVYELHVRDFSIGDETVDEEDRGTYRAFTDPGTDGMSHLADLSEDGLTSVHLLPFAHFGVEPENREEHRTPDCDLADLPPDSEEQQACIAEVAAEDGFNWGYVTEHFTVPEGSYASDPDGAARTLELREMVAGLNGTGLRTVMDVVYNHTGSVGQDGDNNLDRIVPGYYHRLDETGEVTDSTCCPNTAAEHTMMNKLIIDSVLTWATDYKIDGFRFDLMGHHPKQTMVDLRAELDGLTVEEDGVDGAAVHLYGEGWNFGEVEDDARFEQATQANMAGTGIGTFDDRLRDSVRGGGCCDEDPRVQGFGSGLYTDPNGADINGTEEEQLEELLLAQDRIKVGLSGSLADYTLVDRTGEAVTGAEVDYNGEPAGYTAHPQETVTYVAAHDDLDLFDALAYKLPEGTSMEDRVRMQTLSLGTSAFGQGVTFWHAGSEMLRSKSLDDNSYDSGDWFNLYDPSMSDNGFGRGLPRAEYNEDQWDLAGPLLADADLKPSSDQIVDAALRSRELLSIRESTPLFHLGDTDTIQEKLSFHGEGPEQTPGVITMRIDDTVGEEADPELDGLVVVFNASPEEITQTVAETEGQGYALHPVQAEGTDDRVQEADFDSDAGEFTVPARTVAVFVD
ncbi:pullulanase-type alpha-1,6-glucosidase [Nocardiopsis oceani]